MSSPRTLLLYFYSFSFLLSIFGPIRYDNIVHSYFIVYSILAIAIFYFAFSLGEGRQNRWVTLRPIGRPPRIFYPILWIVTLYLLSQVVTTVFTTGISGISFNAGAEQYARVYEDYRRNSGSYSIRWLIGEAFYPLIVATFSWGFFYFRNVPCLYRYIIVTTSVFALIGLGIMAGKQKYIGDLIIIIAFVFIATGEGRGIPIRKKLKLLGGLMLGVAVLVTILSYRYSNAGISLYNINEKSLSFVQFDTNSILVTLFGYEIGFALLQFSGYFTNGFYGLSLCLRLPFEWTELVGHSYTLMVVTGGLSTDFMLDQTYPFRAGVEFGWGMNKWHTAFSWYASDLTFPGTLLAFAFASFTYGRVWRGVSVRRDPYAVPLFALLSIGFVFVPSNNQLMISPGSVLTVAIFFLVWMFPRKTDGKTHSLNGSTASAVP